MRPLLEGTLRARWRALRRWSVCFLAVPWLGSVAGYRAANFAAPSSLWGAAAAAGLAGFFARRSSLKRALLWAAVFLAQTAWVVGEFDSFALWERTFSRGERGVLTGQPLAIRPYDGKRLALSIRVSGDGRSDHSKAPWNVRLIAGPLDLAGSLEKGGGRSWPVRMYPFRPPGNPGEFDRRAWAMGRGYVATAYFEGEEEETGRPAPEEGLELAEACSRTRGLVEALLAPGVAKFLHRVAWRWRCRLIQAGGASTGIALGLLLGQTDLISDEARDAFSRAGLAHLLAVSGLHVGFVALAAVALARRVGRRFSWEWLGSAAALAYAGVVGGPPSALRSAGMLVAGAVGRLFHRRFDGFQLLYLAGGALLTLEPLLALDLGFQLSVAATASILGAVQITSKPPAAGRLRRVIHRLLQGMAVSAAAQAGTIPLAAKAFSSFAWIAPATNLVAVPVSGIALVLLLVGSALADVWEPLGAPAVKGGILLSDQLLTLARATAPWGGLEVPMGSLLSAAGWYALLVGVLQLLRGARRPQRWRALAAAKTLLLAGLAALVAHSAAPTVKGILGVVEVRVLDVGQGDSILVRSPWGRYLLVDGGGVPGAASTGGYDVGALRVVPALRRLGVKRLEAVVNTHPHEDHVHGLAAVVEAREVGRAFGSYAEGSGGAYRAFLQALDAKRLPLEHLERGQVLSLEPGVRLRVLSGGNLLEWGGTGAPAPPGANNRSIALRLEWGERRFLLLGDAEAPLLRRLAEEWGLEANGLVVPHHGGASSFSTALYEEAGAEVAVISVGPNHFGHPDPSLLRYLAAGDVDVYRTDQSGSVLVQYWPWGVRVQTVRNPGFGGVNPALQEGESGG